MLLKFLIKPLAVEFSHSDIQSTESELPIEIQIDPVQNPDKHHLDFGKNLILASTQNRKYPLYKQCNSEWRNDIISTKTICKVGCLMSSMSMALSGLGRKIDGGPINPHTLNAWLKSHGGYSENLFVWGSVTSSFDLKYLGKFNDVTNYVNDDHVVILNVHNGGHWVLATSYSGGTYQVNDPGFSTTSYTTGEVLQGAVYEIN